MAKGNKKKSKKKLFIFGALGILLVVIVVLVVTSGDKEAIISVQTEDAQKRSITQVVTATGKIYPEYQVVLRPEVSGEIVELPVEEGDVVKKGQLLVRIRPEQYIAQRNQARAQLESAKAVLTVRQADLNRVESEYKRIQGLFAKGLASDQEMENAKSSYLQSKGQFDSQTATVMNNEENLKNSEEQLAKTTIYSPINGRVTDLQVELSERVLGSSFSVGTHLMTVADLGNMEARVEVDENDVVLVSVGDTAKVEVDAFDDQKFIGIVSQIGNSAETVGQGTQDEVVNFEVRIKIVNTEAQLLPGMSCDSDIETETRTDVVSIPIQSVTARLPKMSGGEGGGPEGPPMGEANGKRSKPKEVVFVLDGNKVKQIEVETGISDDNFIEIKSGLEGGEKVVSGPYRAISKELEDGSTVMAPQQAGQKKEGEAEKKEEN